MQAENAKTGDVESTTTEPTDTARQAAESSTDHPVENQAKTDAPQGEQPAEQSAPSAEKPADESAQAAVEQPAEPKKATPERKPHPNRVAFDELHELYPELFTLRAAKPLKIGIHKDLAEDGKLSKTRIRRALNFYVRQLAYLRAVAAGGERHGLTGPSGEVTEKDQAHAQEQVKEIEEKRRARRAEQKTNQRGKGRRGKPGDKAAKSGDKTGDRSEKSGQSRPKRRPPKNQNEQNKPAQPRKDPETRMQDKLASLQERFNQSK